MKQFDGKSEQDLTDLRDASQSVSVDSSDDYTINVAERLRRLPPYLFGRLNKIKFERRRAGVDLIDLGMGNPSDPTPERIVEQLVKAVRDPRNHRYSVSVGIFNLRREVAKHYQQRYGVELDPENEVVATIGSKEGFSHMCLALLGPGDTALVPDPFFPIHVYAVALAGASVINVPLGDGPEFIKDTERVIQMLYPRPKVLILNYPHNPTAMTVDLGFYEEVVAVAKRYGLMLISDFAYGETVFDGYKAPSLLQVPGAKDIAVEFTTMSKPFNMAGWRIGFATGNSEMLRAMAKIKGYYDYGIFQPIQIASIIALRECMECAEEQARVYQARRDVLCDGLERIGWTAPRPRGGMFVWVPMPDAYRDMGSIEFCLKLINEAEVAVAPGRAFGENGEGYLRFALVENENRLRQAIRQIGRALGQAQSGPKPAKKIHEE